MGFSGINFDWWAGLLPVVVRRCAWGLFIAVFLAGCSFAALNRPSQYTVKRGDTLYSIARSYELNWREVARWNNITAPYRLSPGQVLSLERYPAVASLPRSSGSTTTSRPKKKLPEKKAAPPARAKQPALVIDRSKNWRWPSDGRVLRTYSQTAPRHGIDIGGALGDKIVAAESGRVVYSGAGLKGYGKLLIIKHDDRFLTAYGFNRKVFVAQGDKVKAGQKIAEMGVGPRNEHLLHFELRQDGQPVDPQRLLPRR